MNELHRLSKKRFRNEITDKELRVKRRKVLEKTYGYRAHLPPVVEKNEHSDAETVVPSITEASVSKTKPSAQSASPNENKHSQTESAKEAAHTAPLDNATQDQSTKDEVYTQANLASTHATSPQAHASSDEPSSKNKMLPIAAAIVVVVGAAGFYFSQSGDDAQNNAQLAQSNQTNAQQVDLQRQFAQLVESDNYSDESIDMFLNFYPLASESQKADFLAELDEKILELDPEISDKLAYIQTLIRRSENDLVKQTKAILNGAQDNNAFSQLTKQWNAASPSQKNVFIDYISSTYQDFVVDFDNEQNVMVVEAILNQLDITSSVKSVDLPQSTYANTPSKQPIVTEDKEPPSPSTVAPKPVTETNSNTTSPPDEVQLASSNTKQAETAVAEVTEKTKANIEDTTSNVVAEVEQTANNVIAKPEPQPKVQDNATAAQISPVEKPETAPNQITEPTEKVVSNVDANNIEVLTAKINSLLSKDSLRNKDDTTALAESTRALYKLMTQSYLEQGMPNAKVAAKKDTFGVFEQHERFAFHYYDVELFFTQRTKNEIKPDMKTVDTMKALAKLFKNAQIPERPPEA